MNIKLLVATHKEYPMPEDSMYLPIHVGKELSSLYLPWVGDNTGEHISSKNPNYCELTALYWAWKNLDADVIGLSHYRRHFAMHKPGFFCKNKFPFVLKSTDVESLLKTTSVLLPKPRNYFIETNYSQFVHAHPAESLELTKHIIKAKYPEYTTYIEPVMNRTTAHRFNMLIMKKDIFDQYCSWLFDILFELEHQLDISSYDAYNQRIFGFISERLLDVFIEANHIEYKELPVIFMEQEHWIKKGTAFLKRKFFH
ncbi:MAG: DUF4422 domain-containing protein [Lachnospiraceae bacterium]|nr:DUF4422 domain-containing protein [Lachnospiraceae bacterium]MBQ8634159.1 DUF4422 domain-containing protein [Lachnospiraceae bacterium]